MILVFTSYECLNNMFLRHNTIKNDYILSLDFFMFFNVDYAIKCTNQGKK